MSNIKCDNCEQTFSSNDALKYHKNNNACKIRNVMCDYCDAKFTSTASMRRHIQNSCPGKKERDNINNEILQKFVEMQEKIGKDNEELRKEFKRENNKLRKDNENLRKDNESLKKQVKNLTVDQKKVRVIKNTNNGIIDKSKNMNNGLIINNVTLVGYGNEKIETLSESEILDSLQEGRYALTKLTEALHF